MIRALVFSTYFTFKIHFQQVLSSITLHIWDIRTCDIFSVTTNAPKAICQCCQLWLRSLKQMSITVSVQKSPSLHWCLLLHLVLVVWFGSEFSFLIEVACSLVGWWLPWGSHCWQACIWDQIACFWSFSNIVFGLFFFTFLVLFQKKTWCLLPSWTLTLSLVNPTSWWVSMIEVAMMFLVMVKVPWFSWAWSRRLCKSWVTLSPNHPWLPLLLDQAGDGGGVDGKAKHEQTWHKVG